MFFGRLQQKISHDIPNLVELYAQTANDNTCAVWHSRSVVLPLKCGVGGIYHASSLIEIQLRHFGLHLGNLSKIFISCYELELCGPLASFPKKYPNKYHLWCISHKNTRLACFLELI